MQVARKQARRDGTRRDEMLSNQGKPHRVCIIPLSHDTLVLVMEK